MESLNIIIQPQFSKAVSSIWSKSNDKMAINNSTSPKLINVSTLKNQTSDNILSHSQNFHSNNHSLIRYTDSQTSENQTFPVLPESIQFFQ